ncbi:hypothetical protein CVT25_013375 [Psilocybe cyanescens]|uniref:Uncharacterized protein n=1 Tax=Psilocybe cyanescens TaxID=93625 RepID=A0A409WSF1_PSICY|nr:hypothetical protein CVT25_013375 [Psilocybe cyanescens]
MGYAVVAAGIGAGIDNDEMNLHPGTRVQLPRWWCSLPGPTVHMDDTDWRLSLLLPRQALAEDPTSSRDVGRTFVEDPTQGGRRERIRPTAIRLWLWGRCEGVSMG